MASRYKAGPRLVRPGAGAGLAGLRPPSGGAIAKPVAKPVPQAGAAVPQRRAVKPTGPRAAPQQLEPEPAVQTSQEIKVGDRVLVGGVKPGVVAYLGSTQFAPRGIWAGIILDSSDGKNNGVVQGVAYFECEQNRGLFSRLEKLMLIPHESGPRSTVTGPLQKNTRTPAAPSDASVEFSVGDRILVDGSKPGTVAFLGTTEFARGEWAGVILDAPEGKNSGTVGGTQYFKCEPNHGLFSRPNRLLMAKKAQASPPRERHGIRSRSPQPGLANDPETQRQAAIQHSMQSTPVNPEQLQTLREKLKLGDRVLVGGQKEGFLRYMGPTEFAKGVWVGVELEDSLGKNDGAVSGKRYFQCEPKHGLFAPLPKVEKLASAASEPASPIITPARHTAVARQLSSSSTSSMGSVLRQSMDSQGGLADLLHEREKLIAALQFSAEEADKEKRSLEERIREMTRQVEDLQFQLEEQGIVSGDQLENSEESSKQLLAAARRQLVEEKESRAGLEDQLQTKEALLQEEHTRLSHALEELSSAATKDSSATDALRERVGRVEGELEERGREVASNLDTIAALRAEVSSLRGEQGVAGEREAELRAELESRDEELSRVNSDLKSANTATAELQRECEGAEERWRQLSEDKAELEAQLLQLAHSSGDSSQQLSFLASQLQEKERQVEAGQAQSSQLSSEVRCVREELEQVREEGEAERKKSQAFEAELTQAEGMVGALQAELTASRQALEAAGDQESHAQSMLEESGRENSSLREEVRSLSKQRELWAGERERLVSEQDRLIGDRDRALAEADRLRAENASVSTEQSSLSHERMELLSERDRLLAENQALHTEAERATGDTEAARQALQELHAMRQEAIGKTQEINLKYDTTQSELSGALGEVQRLQGELASQREAKQSDQMVLQEELELARASSLELRGRLERVTGEHDATLGQAQALAVRLEEAEGEREQLAAARAQLEEMQDQMEELSRSHTTLELETNMEASTLRLQLEENESLLADRGRELYEAQERVTALSEELVLSLGKRDQMELGEEKQLLEEEKQLLEEEKALLEERVWELTEQLEKSQSATTTVQGNHVEADVNKTTVRLQEAQKQLLESHVERETLISTVGDLEQQVDFLNSVIADLQGKLETAETLAGLHGPIDGYEDDEDEQGLPPPRLFCDMCDVFDEHDTDDCPLQATSDSPPHSSYHGAKAPGGSDRPYCANCELFGHLTEECDYDATY